ncbi:TrkA C-terminal domain-containing protein [Desulfonatronum parangueonense]
MIAIVSLLIVIFLSLLFTRIASIALTHTGMTRASARFQARSAFSGAGFTTAESESVVNHPVRRKIVMMLILAGNAGIVAAISTLILTFVQEGDAASLTLRIVSLVTGIVLLWALATSRWVDHLLARAVTKLLKKYTALDVTDYADLLQLTGDYRLAELRIEKGDWIEGKKLAEARLREEGINVLGIKKPDGTYIGVIGGDDSIEEGDSLVIYGRIQAIKDIDQRRKGRQGEIKHQQAVQEQEKIVGEEKEKASESP